MFKSAILFLLILGCLSCEDCETFTCNYDDPLEEIGWLNELKMVFDASNQTAKINQYTYEGDIVFEVDDCFGCGDALIIVYDCHKNILCQFGGIAGLNTCPDFYETASDKIILYDN